MSKTKSADRTRSAKQRVGSRRNKKLKNVKPFASDARPRNGVGA